MSQSNRRDRGALVALLLTLAAIVFIAWLSDQAGGGIGQPDSSKIQNAQQDDVDRLVAAIREFDPWDDTLAQWLMALFTIAATGVSLKAVLLVRDSLALNRAATNAAIRAAVAAERSADVTREVGQAQVRAYLQFKPSNLNYLRTSDGDGIKITGELVNRGQSTALNVEAGGLVTLKKPEVGGALDERITMTPCIASLAPGANHQSVEVTIPFKQFIGEEDAGEELWCLIAIRYLDVFGRAGREDFRGKFLDAARKPLSVNGLVYAAGSGKVLFTSV